MSFKSQLGLIKGHFVNLSVFLARESTINPKLKNHRKIVFVDIEKNHWHRYILMLLLFFEKEGYQIVLRYRFGFFGHWGTKPLLKWLKTLMIKFSNRTQNHATIILHTYPDKYKSDNAFFLSYEFYKTPFPHELKIPMCAVDTWYVKNIWFEPDLIARRNISLLFVGNIEKEFYDRAELTEKFNLVNRYQLCKYVFQELPVHRPKNYAELMELDKLGLTVVDRNYGFYLKPHDLAQVLQTTNFFLCPPGVVMPHCHNIVEAMSFGVIPLLEYAHEMVPKLEHLKNCITFSGKEDCVAKIKLVLDMPEQDIKHMRREVMNYYVNYLSVNSVVNSIEESIGSKNIILLNAEYPSVEILPFL